MSSYCKKEASIRGQDVIVLQKRGVDRPWEGALWARERDCRADEGRLGMKCARLFTKTLGSFAYGEVATGHHKQIP